MDEFEKIIFNTEFNEKEENKILSAMKSKRIIKKIKGII